MATSHLESKNIDGYIIAEQILNARHQLKLTQQQAAINVGISRQEWSQLENGVALPAKRLQAVIFYLGIQNLQAQHPRSRDYDWWQHWMNTLLSVIHCPQVYPEDRSNALEALSQQIQTWTCPAWALDTETWDVLVVNQRFISYWNDVYFDKVMNFFDLILDPQWGWIQHMEQNPSTLILRKKLVATYRLTSAMFGESDRRSSLVKRLGDLYPEFSDAYFNPHPRPLLGPYKIRWTSPTSGTEDLVAVTWQPWMSHQIIVRSYNPAS